MNPKNVVHDTSYGVVPVIKKNGQWQVLLIHMNAGHWSFPKGHPEKGETPLESAQRELYEETNLTVSRLLTDQLFEENYFFTKDHHLFKKTVLYFLAEVVGEVATQKEEIQAAKWLSFQDALEILTFEEDKNLFKQTFTYLK